MESAEECRCGLSKDEPCDFVEIGGALPDGRARGLNTRRPPSTGLQRLREADLEVCRLPGRTIADCPLQLRILPEAERCAGQAAARLGNRQSCADNPRRLFAGAREGLG